MNPITEDEYDDLDIPYTPIDSILVTLGDAFDIDPLALIDSVIEGRSSSYDKDAQTMIDMLDLALNSSTELPHIRRGIEFLLQLED